eukprot:CCRYP_006691-RA/>CCRYP_006691-RA protein AED:0.47 eAED:0.56 QI:0/0/0/1/0/0/2/0/68
MARKTYWTLTVLWETLPVSGSDIVLSTALRKGRYVTSLCPSEYRWYEQFTMGVSARMVNMSRNGPSRI